MIVPMSKAVVIVQDKDSLQAMQDLRREGVLHVQHTHPPQAEDISLLQEEVALADAALEVFRQSGVKAQEKENFSYPGEWKTKARHIVELWKRHEHLATYSFTLRNAISEYAPWGDFDPQQIKELEAKGLFIKLFHLPLKQLQEFPQDVCVLPIRKSAGMCYCVTIARRHFETDFKEINLPRLGISGMRQRIQEDEAVLAGLRREIHQAAALEPVLKGIRQKLRRDIEFARALSGMAKEEKLAYVRGFVPEDALAGLRQKAQEKKWGLLISEPADEDAVPTLIRNPAWVEAIRPVFKLLEIIPGYRELDISPVFLGFLSLFFGMIIGDAGYGMLYFLLTLWAQKKLSARLPDRRVFALFYIFSSCAVFWGLLTGTFFGQEWYLKAGFKPLIPILNDTKFLQAFCFFLGAVHLTVAHGWQALRKLPSFNAFQDLGWIAVLWAAFFLAKMLILGDPFPVFAKHLLIAGILQVILSTQPQKNILKMLGAGLGAVALNLMNNFTDVVSYVRLFAVGLAGVAIADTVNALAADTGGNLIVSGLIVFAGHTINIILGPMSVLVHGIRLNVLEFSGHAGLSWGGIAYKPLKE